MNELNTYQHLPGKVLKSASNKKKQPSFESGKINLNHEILQELLDQNSLDLMIKLLFKTMAKPSAEADLGIFYQKFTEIILHIIAETKYANSIAITSDEFLEIIRVALEEQMNNSL